MYMLTEQELILEQELKDKRAEHEIREGALQAVKRGLAKPENVEDIIAQFRAYKADRIAMKKECQGLVVGYCMGKRIVAKNEDLLTDEQKKIDPDEKHMIYIVDLSEDCIH